MFSPEPDWIHEVVGHAVVLGDPHVAAMYRLFGTAAEKARSTERLGEIERVFWYTAEVGVIMEEGQPKAFGAALLSSVNEIQGFAHAEIVPFDPQLMVNTEYDETKPQTRLFAARSLSALLESLLC